VRDLLDFARPALPALVPIDLAAAVDASLRLARVQSRFRAVEVRQDFAPGLPRVVADEHHVAQVLLNILLNAGDAMNGAGEVRIAARVAPDAPERVTLSIEDSGPGIAAPDLPRIFDPFFTTKDPGQGSGLGLAISHRIMEELGGDIAARNGERGGAVFELGFLVAGG
jgi:two-component system NtrC family sensor kinase